MIAVAAIDLLDGQAVQLVKGNPESVPIRRPDPESVCLAWIEAGFRRLHVIDLDGALGRGTNAGPIGALLRGSGVPVQIGGGIRDRAAATRWLEAGADRVIVGTRAITDPTWGTELARTFPGRVVVAADVLGGEVVTHGWTAGSGEPIEPLLRAYADAPIAAFLVTDVDREGQERGCDRDLFASVVAASEHPVIAAGSISSVDDLRALESAGVAEAVLGMALYTGTLQPETLSPWLNENPGRTAPVTGETP